MRGHDAPPAALAAFHWERFVFEDEVNGSGMGSPHAEGLHSGMSVVGLGGGGIDFGVVSDRLNGGGEGLFIRVFVVD